MNSGRAASLEQGPDCAAIRMTEDKVWSFSQLDFELLLCLNSDLCFSVPFRSDFSTLENETILNGINRLAMGEVLLLDAGQETIETCAEVRAVLELMANAGRIVKVYSAFHGGICFFLYFAPEGCASIEISAVKAGVVKLGTMQRNQFEEACLQAIGDALPVSGESVQQAVLGMDPIAREAMERTSFSSTDEEAILSGCSLMVNDYDADGSSLCVRYAFYTAGRRDLCLVCEPDERKVELGCRRWAQRLAQEFFGGIV